MTKEEHDVYIEEVKKTIAESIELNVNGKIRRLDEKLTQYIEDDLAWKEIATPIIKAGNDLRGAGKLAVYFFGGLATIAGGVAVIRIALIDLLK